MQALLQHRPGAAPTASRMRQDHDRVLLGVYTSTIFLNAGLLFLVQPMFSRMVLPLLGGSATVWTTCMLFFQAALLAGYFYAHVMPRWLGPERQAWTHIALLLLSLLTLPVAVNTATGPGAQDHPVAASLSRARKRRAGVPLGCGTRRRACRRAQTGRGHLRP